MEVERMVPDRPSNTDLANEVYKNEDKKTSHPAKNKNLKQEFFGKGIKLAGVEKKNISLFSGNKEEKIIDDEDIVSYEIREGHKTAILKVAHKMEDGTYKYFEIEGTKANPENNEGATFQIGDNQDKFEIKDIKFWQKAEAKLVNPDSKDTSTESWEMKGLGNQKQIITKANAKNSLAGMTTLIGMLREKKEFDKIGQIKSPGSMFSKLLGFPEVAAFKSRSVRAKLILQRLFDPYCVIWDRVVVKTDESGKELTDGNGDQITEIVKPAVPARILKHLFVVGAGIGAMAIAATIFSSSLAIFPVSWLIIIIGAVVVFPGVTRFLYRTGIIPAIALIVLSGGNPIIIGVAAFVIFGALVFSWLYSSALNKSAQLSLEGKNNQAFAMLVLAWFLSLPAALTNGLLGLFTRSTYMDRIDVMDSLNETKSKKRFVALFFFFKIIPSAIKTAPKAFLIVLAVALLPLLAAPSGLAFVLLAPQQSGMIHLSLTVLSYYGSFVGPLFGAQLSAGSLIHLIMSSSLPLSTIYAFAGLATVWVSWPIVFAGFRFLKGFADFGQGRTFRSPTLSQTMNIADLKNPTISDYLHAIVEGSLNNGVGFFIEKFGKLIVKSLVLDKLDKLSDSEEMNEILNAENEVIKDLDAKNVADFEWAARMYRKILKSETYVEGMEQTAANLREYLSMVNPDLCREIMEDALTANLQNINEKVDELNKDEKWSKLVKNEKEKIIETCYKEVIEGQYSPHMKELAKELNTAVGRYWNTTNEREKEKYREQIEIIAEYCKGLNKVPEFKAYLAEFNDLHAAKYHDHQSGQFVSKTRAELASEKFDEYFRTIQGLEENKQPAPAIKANGNTSNLLVKNSRYNNNKLKLAMAGFRTWLNKSTTGKRCLMHVESGKPVSLWQKLTSPTWWRTGHVEFKPKEIETLYKEEHDKNIVRIVKKAQDIAINSIFIDPTDMTKTAEIVIYEKVNHILYTKLLAGNHAGTTIDMIKQIKRLISDLGIPNLNKPWNQLTTLEKKVVFDQLRLLEKSDLQDKKMLGTCIFQVLTVETNQILLKEGKSVFETEQENSPEINEDLRLQAFYKLYEKVDEKVDTKIAYKDKTLEIITQEIDKEKAKLKSALVLETQDNQKILEKLENDQLEAQQKKAEAEELYNREKALLLEEANEKLTPLKQVLTSANADVTNIEQLQQNQSAHFKNFVRNNRAETEKLEKYRADLGNAITLLFEDHAEKIQAKLFIEPAFATGAMAKILNLNNIKDNMLRLDLLEDEEANVKAKAARKYEIIANTKYILTNFWKRAIEEAIIPIKSQLSFDTSEIVEEIEQPLQNDDLSREAAELVLQKTTYVKSQKIKNKEKEIFEQALDERSFNNTITQYKNNLDLPNELLHKTPESVEHPYRNSMRHAAEQYYKGDSKDIEHEPEKINQAINNLSAKVALTTSEADIKKTITSTTKDIQAELQLSAKETKAFEYPETPSEWAASRGWTKFSKYYWPKFTRFIRPAGTRLSTLGRSLMNIFRTTNKEQYSQFGSSQITSAASLDQNGATAKLSREFGPGTQEKSELFLERQLELKKFQEQYAIMYEGLRKDQTKLSQKINKYKSTLQELKDTVLTDAVLADIDKALQLEKVAHEVEMIEMVEMPQDRTIKPSLIEEGTE
jgi:hypothetical protein